MSHRLRYVIPLLFALLMGAQAQATDPRVYRLEYALDLRPAPSPALVSMTVVQSGGELRRVRFAADDPRFQDFASPAGLTRDGDEYVWAVPREGGRLSWRAVITHQRGAGEVDARLGKRWALFRGEDAFPAMASVALRGAESDAALQVELPGKWSFVSPFEEAGSGYAIVNPERRFDRPTGWIVAGNVGVRFNRIAGVRVSVAAPVGEDVRRQDMLALLNWTMPDMLRLLPGFPGDLLVVSAGDPFWRGGLSGPGSLYVHADRPLISENGTSTLLHELFHVGFARSAARGDDWIVEGLAEYYSVELLRRSATVTNARHEKTLRSLARWAKKANRLRATKAGGAVTARAVGVFLELDAELRALSGGDRSLDDVVRRLAQERTRALTLAELASVFEQVAGKPSEVLRKLV